jgi:hypothetical protein
MLFLIYIQSSLILYSSIELKKIDSIEEKLLWIL